MGMRKEFHVNLRIKIIYINIIVLFVCVFFLMDYAFQKSRNLLIEQEAGIVTQYMDRNKIALQGVMDSIRKISAASSTNKQVAVLLNQSFIGKMYSSENLDRVRSVEDTLTFYRNIFFDYRLHYIILGADGSIYSVVDGIDNKNYFAQNFSDEVRSQEWYRNFLKDNSVSRWITPCSYTNKGEFSEEGETFILFIRRIRDYNSQRFLGVSFVSFPTSNLSQILIPYEGSTLALFNEGKRLIYYDGELDSKAILDEISAHDLDEQMMQEQGYFFYEEENTEYLIHYANMPGTNWQLVNLVPLKEVTKAVDNLYQQMSVMTFLIAAGASLICIAMYIYITAPLNRLIQKISQVRIGKIRVGEQREIEQVGRTVFGVVEAERQISNMVDYIEKMSEETIKQKEIQQNLRYEMLRAQLNPHFLFNTLNVIKWSAMISGAGNVADMITSLGILLENSMNRKEAEVPLKEEIKVVKAWVEIKNWALKNRIQIYEEIPDELQDFPVIKFCLQPLVENAVLHGMENIENGEIHISAKEIDEDVCITIQDNGVGMETEKLERVLEEMDSESKRRHVTGIGLTSIHELMKMKYGANYGLRIESYVGKGTTVYVTFPNQKGGSKC